MSKKDLSFLDMSFLDTSISHQELPHYRNKGTFKMLSIKKSLRYILPFMFLRVQDP